MFEAVNPPWKSRRQQLVTLTFSVVAHVAVIPLLLLLPLLYFTERLPKTPDMGAACSQCR